MKLSQAKTGYLIAKRAEGYAPGTIERTVWALNLLIQSMGDKEIEEITPLDTQEYFSFIRSYVGKHGLLAPSTITTIWATIRSFYKWANGALDTRLSVDIPMPKFSPREIQPLTEAEIERLLKVCEYTQNSTPTEQRNSFRMKRTSALRDRAIILILLDTGIRVSECSRIRIKNISLDNREIEITPWGSGQKTTPRMVYFGSATNNIVWKYLTSRKYEKDDWLFVTREGKQMNRNSIRILLSRLGGAAGVADVTPHRFRHTFAIQFLRNGGDIFNLQRLLGHSSLDMVKRYLAIAQVDTESAHRKASPVDNWKL